MSQFCPDCGRENSDKAKFCASCGTNLATGVPSSSHRDPAAPSAGGTSIVTGAQSPSSASIPQNPLIRIPDGVIVRDRFRIDGILGEGGMGRVYQVFDLNFQEKAALKEMLITTSTSQELQEAQERFVRESRILLKLKHQRIPNIYDFFNIDSRCFIAIEFIEGDTLYEFLKKHSQSDEEEIIEVALQICDILIYLHGQNPPVVFRDLKPQNLMITNDGNLYMIDFGIARELSSRTGTAIGTAGYAAPEVYENRLDTRSDLYSLGGLLHYALTLKDPETRTPFTFHEHPIASYRKTKHEWQKLLDRLLTRRAEERYASAVEVRSVLEGFRSGVSAQVRVAPQVTETPQLKIVTTSNSSHSPLSLPGVKVNPKDGAQMVLIPAGEFLMGNTESEGYSDEHPQHKVYLDACYIYKYEVTNAQFAKFAGEIGYKAKGNWEDFAVSGREQHPVISVTWDDAVAYCNWAGGRLPTEAEWEKAARGTDGRAYPWGNNWDDSKCNWGKGPKVSGMADISEGRGTAPVGSFPEGASPYGCMDMAGNVWEWCSDCYGEKYYKSSPSRNPGGPTGGGDRVLRGGSWGDDVTHVLRCAIRYGDFPDQWLYDYGFRVVCRPSDFP